MTPSPKTMLNRSGARSCSSTCSTATLSVVAKMAPRAKQSCSRTCSTSLRDCQSEEACLNVVVVCMNGDVGESQLTASVMLMNFEKPYSVTAMTAKAIYVPKIPRLAIVGKLRKNAFFRTDSPAYKIMGGKKNLHQHITAECNIQGGT